VPEVGGRLRFWRRTKAAAAARTNASLAALLPLLVWLLPCWAAFSLSACDSAAVDRVFTRQAPDVDRAIDAFSEHDAGAAAERLTDYLGTGPCKDGAIGGSNLGDRPQATFDLGLALFRIAERYGGRFGEDPGRTQDNPSKLAQRSAEVACAISVLEQVVGRRNLSVELRAQANYLLGNLEFLRREYRAAVADYDRAIELIPGEESPTAEGIGRDAAHNRAIALRRAEEDKPKPPHHPDAGPPPPGDAGPPPDQSHGDAGSSSPNDKNQNQNSQQKKQNQNQEKQDRDDQQQDQNQQQQDPKPPDQPQSQNAPQPAPDAQQDKQNAPPPQQHGVSLSQDDKLLDQLERAPTVQQEAARAQRGRVRRVVEDK
jgi:hypothetical protein